MEEDLLYSEKAHFQTATLWRLMHWLLGLPGAAFAAMTSLAASDTLFPEHAALFGVITALLTVLITFTNPNNMAETSHKAGVSFNNLRGRVRRFRNIDIAMSNDIEALRSVLETLASEKGKLLETTPHTGGLPYWLAKRSIERQISHVNSVDLPQ